MFVEPVNVLNGERGDSGYDTHGHCISALGGEMALVACISSDGGCFHRQQLTCIDGVAYSQSRLNTRRIVKGIEPNSELLALLCSVKQTALFS